MNEEMDRDCIDLINKKLSKQINAQEYYIGLMALDKKYPETGFFRSAQEFAKKWLKK